jgi:hypothetical protein
LEREKINTFNIKHFLIWLKKNLSVPNRT